MRQFEARSSIAQSALGHPSKAPTARPAHMSTLATELNVPPNSRHAFDELIAKTSQRLNRTLTSTDLAEWKDSL